MIGNSVKFECGFPVIVEVRDFSNVIIFIAKFYRDRTVACGYVFRVRIAEITLFAHMADDTLVTVSASDALGTVSEALGPIQ